MEILVQRRSLQTASKPPSSFTSFKKRDSRHSASQIQTRQQQVKTIQLISYRNVLQLLVTWVDSLKPRTEHHKGIKVIFNVVWCRWHKQLINCCFAGHPSPKFIQGGRKHSIISSKQHVCGCVEKEHRDKATGPQKAKESQITTGEGLGPKKVAVEFYFFV